MDNADLKENCDNDLYETIFQSPFFFERHCFMITDDFFEILNHNKRYTRKNSILIKNATNL